MCTRLTYVRCNLFFGHFTAVSENLVLIGFFFLDVDSCLCQNCLLYQIYCGVGSVCVSSSMTASLPVGAAEGSEGFDSLLASLAPRFLDNDPPKVGSSHGAHYSKIRLDQQRCTRPVFEVSHWTPFIARETNAKGGTV